jgi:hypothetical protein
MKKYILLFLFILTIAACRPISRGPNPYQALSPLAMMMESPLYSRGESAIPDMPGGLVAPADYRAGTIPAASLPPMRYKLYAPILAHQRSYPCNMQPKAAELYALILAHPEQRRREPYCNQPVTLTAQYRATDMVSNKYFNHTDKYGFGPNHWLDVVGCLPDGYPPNGNSGESITLNYHTAQDALDALLRSRPHRTHVLGLHPFWAAHRVVGVGWAESEWGEVFVVETSEGCK